jgi:hypothetical protein
MWRTPAQTPQNTPISLTLLAQDFWYQHLRLSTTSELYASGFKTDVPFTF